MNRYWDEIMLTIRLAVCLAVAVSIGYGIAKWTGSSRAEFFDSNKPIQPGEWLIQDKPKQFGEGSHKTGWPK